MGPWRRGSALPWHGRGRGFKSRRLHHKKVAFRGFFVYQRLRGSAGQEEQDKLYFDIVTEYGKEEAFRFSPCSIERPGYRDESQGWWPMPLSLIFRLQTEYRKEVGEDWTLK
jgi:hypothetical protein